MFNFPYLIVLIKKLITKRIGEDSLPRKDHFVANKKYEGRIFCVEVGQILEKKINVGLRLLGRREYNETLDTKKRNCNSKKKSGVYFKAMKLVQINFI